MLFPWVGLFEQIRAADTYVHLDDVQFARGYFNRVEIKTTSGTKWLTVPLSELSRWKRINEVRLDAHRDWRQSHIDFLRQAFAGAPFKRDVLDVVQSVYKTDFETLAQLSIASIERVWSYFDLPAKETFLSSELDVPGRSWERILNIVRTLKGDVYITGHGARNYLNHEAFEEAGVRVEYMDYAKLPYPQLHGAFTPYVSMLDLIANRGPTGRDVIRSGTKPWRDFLNA